ncbi:MAG TPA: SCO family protein [Kofleriaceae bacterium]|nr:SCO family protein [Kofleriaceae bacterium]
MSSGPAATAATAATAAAASAPGAVPRPAGPRRRGIPGRLLLLALLGILLLAVIPAVVVPTILARAAQPELADLGELPAFSLVDQHGEAFTEEALRGHPTIVGFVFTRCETICPVITAKMHGIQDKTADRKGAAIKLLSISVDPAYDTPPRLLEYATFHQADFARWRFLTGPKERVLALVEGPFMNSMREEGKTSSGAPAISHSGYLVLVDGDLKIRGVYDSNDLQALERLMRDARFLARTHRSYKFGGGP